MEPQTTNLFDLQIDQPSSIYLREIAKWTKFLSVLGFVICGILVIVGIFFGSAMSTLMGMGQFSENVGTSRALGVIIPIVYICIALFYFFPCLYLYKFSVKMKSSLITNDQQTVAEAFKNLKSCFKFIGIVTIIFLSFYALALVIGIATSAFR